MDTSGFLLSSLFTNHIGKSGGRGLSPRLWSRIAAQAMSPDGGSNGVFVFDDFLNFSGMAPGASLVLPSATVPGPNGYGVSIEGTTTQGSISNLATESYGVVRLTASATDNHETWLAGQGNVGTLGAISNTGSSVHNRLTIFETRVRFTQVSDNGGAVFVGLAIPGTAANNGKVDDTGVMADKDFIGFNTIHADGDLLSINYKKTGQTQQAVGAGRAIAAATWYKLGFIFDPKNTDRFKFYIDNVEYTGVSGSNQVAAPITAGVVNATTPVFATTFPDAVRMSFLAGIKTGSAAAVSMDIDWWAYYQRAEM